MTIIVTIHSSGCCQQCTSSVYHCGNPSFLPHMHTVNGICARHVLRVVLAGDTTTTNVTSPITTAVPQVLLDNTAVYHCKDMPPQHTMHGLTTPQDIAAVVHRRCHHTPTLTQKTTITLCTNARTVAQHNEHNMKYCSITAPARQVAATNGTQQLCLLCATTCLLAAGTNGFIEPDNDVCCAQQR